MNAASVATETARARVTPEQVDQASEIVDRLGTWPLLTELERREPDLTELVLEELTELHHALYQMRVPPAKLKRYGRRLRRLCCNLIVALRPDLAD